MLLTDTVVLSMNNVYVNALAIIIINMLKNNKIMHKNNKIMHKNNKIMHKNNKTLT